MERRFVLFLVSAFLIVMANALVSALFFPRQPAAAPKEDEVAQADKPAKKERPKEKPAVEEPDEPDADLPAAETEDKAEDEVARPDDEAGDEKPKVADAVGAGAKTKPFPDRRISLGSYDPNSGYRLLVTLTSRGAAVERVELNDPQYRELEDRSGYIGHLAPADVPHGAGCRLQVVGRETPAAVAGLEADDIVRQFAGKSIKSAVAFESALKETEAGQEIEIGVERQGKPLTLQVHLGRRPIEIIRPEFDHSTLDVLASPHDPLSLLLTLEQAGKRKLGEGAKELKGVDLLGGNWEVVETAADEALFRRQFESLGLEITKRFRLAKIAAPQENPDAPVYNLLLNVGIRNTSKVAQDVAYRLDGPTGLPLEGSWYATKISRTWGAAGMRDVITRFDGPGKAAEQDSCLAIVDAKAGKIESSSESQGPLDFIAVDAQYFSAALLPRKALPGDIWLEDIRPIRVGAIPTEKSEKKLTDVSFRLVSKAFELEPGAKIDHEYEVFAGPKKPALLDQYSNGDASLGELVYYGWFGWVSKAMLIVLHFFYRLVHNYGVAIIMLTVMVRGGLFPFSRKQALSAQKMQELRPEIQRITEKYKKPEERTRAQQELFRKHKYNPFGGCLLVFLQLPIFVGLYRSLSVDVELRQAPLVSDTIRWASNLAAPDMLWDWSQRLPGFVTSYLGPYLNVFPLITIALMIWQQKMFLPPPADEQAALQQKMMSYMMIFMGFLFYKVPCGLCLYFIASSLWGITERKLLPKPSVPGQASESGGAALANRSDGGNGAPKGKKRQPGRK